MPPEIVAGRYRLAERLGAGAFGEVFAAFDEGPLQRKVALKLLRGEGDAPAREEHARRFLTEVRLAGALRHPHIAVVHDAGLWEGRLYMVQELVDGADLGRFLAEHAPLSVELVLRLAADLLDALASAHEQGVVHRDIKPGNLLIDREHRLVVVDFGLATSTHPEVEARDGSPGTPGYAAPEQIRGGGDARSDQFSVAAVLYQMLTGAAPFVGKNLPETLRRTLTHQPPPPSTLRPELPPGLDRVLARALSKDPAERYPDLRAMAEDLAGHAAFDAMTSGLLRDVLLCAALAGRLVLIAGAEGSVGRGAPLALTLGAPPQSAENRRIVTDPREEVYPSSGAPALLALADDEALDRLVEASDGLRAALVTGTLLVLDRPPTAPLRRLLAVIRGWGASPMVVQAALRWTPAELREAERRGIRALEYGPGALLAELRAELPGVPPLATARLPERPYKFLSYFEADDAAIFFGRDAEIARMTARILARPVSLLYGASGAGKTSLVRAALVPRLLSAGHRVALARVMDEPMAEIGRAVGLPPETEDASAALARAARECSLLVVFLDQLEELFLRFPRPARARLAEDLRRALEASEGHLRLVLCLRADFLARLSELREHLPLSLESGLYLEPLSSEAARAAITGPAALHGVGLSDALLDRMLADLGGDGVDPPQLQLVCDALWRARAPDQAEIGVSDYQALGETRTILARHLASALDDLPSDDQEPARALLKAMVSTLDTRSVRRVEDLALAARIPPSRVAALLDGLQARRLVRPIAREDGVWIELTHEVLAAEISRWLSEDDRRLAGVRELLEQGVRGYEQLGLLLSPAQLALITPMEHRLSLSDAQQALLARSRAARSQGRRRTVAQGLAALLVLALAGLVARGAWLSGHVYARATEGSLSRKWWGQKQVQSTDPISLYRGAASPWPIDGLLGYPRLDRQTDWSMNDLRPDVRDALREGVDLPRADQAVSWFEERLTPLAAARARWVSGDLSASGDEIRALAEDPATGAEATLELASSLALSGEVPADAVQALIAVAQQRAAALRIPGGTTQLRGRVGGPLGLLLIRTPAGIWRPTLDALTRQERGPELVGDLLEAGGAPEDLDGLAPSLKSRSTSNVEAAIRAVVASGACAWQDDVRAAYAAIPGAAPGEDLIRALTYLCDVCGTRADLPLLSELYRGSLDGRLDPDFSLPILRPIARIDPRLGAELLRERERSPATRGGVVATPWGYRGNAEMIGLLTPDTPPSLHGRLYLGDAGAVWPAWRFAMADPGDPSRVGWLRPLALYQGEPLWRAAREALTQGHPPLHVEVALLTILGREGPEAAEAIGTGLASEDLLPVQTAVGELSAMKGPLPADLGGPSRQAALARAVVAVRRGEPVSTELFEAALADPQATWQELVLAVDGLRRALLAAPPATAWAALESPWARVRLAATLALAARDDAPAPVSADPWLQRSIARVSWAKRVFEADRALLAEARGQVDQGRPRRAHQILVAVRGEHGVGAALEATLSPELSGVWPSELEDEAIYLQALADLGAGIAPAVEWMYTYIPRALWPRYASEPSLAALRDSYALRVLTGQIPAGDVESP